jgi:predicted nucleic acid-binding protein
MKIFADTSGLFAFMVENDFMHVRARENFRYFAQRKARLLTSSLVLVETTALLQRRIGMGAVHDFNRSIVPLMDVVWADSPWHERAMRRLFLINRKDVSLVDCLSFEIMDHHDIDCAFTFDRHFEEQGFRMAAFHDL